MKISYKRCGMCGRLITEAHPKRLLLQEHRVRTRSYAYSTEQEYNLCEDCEEKFKELMKGTAKK